MFKQRVTEKYLEVINRKKFNIRSLYCKFFYDQLSENIGIVALRLLKSQIPVEQTQSHLWCQLTEFFTPIRKRRTLV